MPPGQAAPIVVATYGGELATHQAWLATTIIEQGFGYTTVARDPANNGVVVRDLREGKLDVAMEIWQIPGRDDEWAAVVESGQVIDLGHSPEGTWESSFAIPQYLAEATPGLRTVSDLADAKYKRLFEGQPGGRAQINTCPLGYACRAITQEQVFGYGLQSHVELVTPPSMLAYERSIRDAFVNEVPWVGHARAPSELSATYDMFPLREARYTGSCWQTDKACSGPTQTMHVARTPSLLERAPDVVRMLERWCIPRYAEASMASNLAWLQIGTWRIAYGWKRTKACGSTGCQITRPQTSGRT